MTKKAIFPNSDYMSKKESEQYFTAINQAMEQLRREFSEDISASTNQLREEMAEGFKKQNETLQTILDIVRVTDVEIKEIKLALWDHHRRLTRVEKQLA